MEKLVVTFSLILLSFGFAGAGFAEDSKETSPGLFCKYLIAPVVMKSQRMCGANNLCVTPIRCVGEAYSSAAGKFVAVREPIFGQASCASNANGTCPDITACFTRSQTEKPVSVGAEPVIDSRGLSSSMSFNGIYVDRTTHDKDTGK